MIRVSFRTKGFPIVIGGPMLTLCLWFVGIPTLGIVLKLAAPQASVTARVVADIY